MQNPAILRFLICLLFLISFFPVVQANESDLVILVDNSGSMKRHDPQFLLSQVLLSFMDQIGSDTRIALISFDKEINTLLPLNTVNPSHERIYDALQQITYRGLRTNIADAVEKGIYLLRNEGRPRATKAILLLTDGYMDTGNVLRDQNKTRWLLRELSEECVQDHIRLFGIAFTETADYQLLQSLAWRTHGDYFRVFDPEEIYTAFHRIQERITLPLASPLSASVPSPASTSIVSSIANTTQVPVTSLAAEASIEATQQPSIQKVPEISPSLAEKAVPLLTNSVSIAASPLSTLPKTSESPIIKLPSIATANEFELTDEYLTDETDSSLLWLFAIFIVAIILLEIRRHYSFSALLDTVRSFPKKWNNRFVKTPSKKYTSSKFSPTTSEIVTESTIDNRAEDINALHQTVKFQLSIASAKEAREAKEAEEIGIKDGLSILSTSEPISVSALAKLVDRRGAQGIGEFPLIYSITIISRSDDWTQSNTAHLHINSPTISRRHAIIEFRNLSFWLRDLGSTNGTYVNRQRIKETEEVELKNNDLIQFHTFGFDFVFLHPEKCENTSQSIAQEI